MKTIEAINDCIPAADQYITELGWVLMPVRGHGCRKPKAPIYDAWPECRPAWEDLEELLRSRPRAGIALNLGASGLVDVEADTPDGESLLDELCDDGRFPCWRAARGKHRLFINDGSIGFLKIGSIEFRAGRHYSILPPSLHASGIRYEWLVTPFNVEPPPFPPKLAQYYLEARAREPQKESKAPGSSKTTPFPFRDNLDYILRQFDLWKVAAEAGVTFTFKRPDANGNVPCYVPDVLRAGNPDEFPSGVFNVFNGRLRDFATGLNHRFFDLMAALERKPWLDVFRDFEAKGKGRKPHSRRVSLPTPQEKPADQITLDHARSQMKAYFRAQL